MYHNFRTTIITKLIPITFICLNISTIHAQSSKFGLYYESRWDPLVFDKEIENSERLDIIRTQSGKLENHSLDNEPATFKKFGDVSIMTLNLFREVIYDTETVESAENIRTILDETHTSILCLQGVDDGLLERINGKLTKSSHYAMANIDKYDNDMLTGQRTYLPIIYDRKLFYVKNSGYFETEGKRKMVYGSFLEFKDLRVPEMNVAFTVINVDMFSSFNDVVSAQFSNIVSDISTFREVKESPVFIAGSIGTLPPNVKDLVSKSYKNTIDIDKNNKDIPKTTVHSGNQDDGIQRDFILIRDERNVFTVNYSRILREFLAGDHYPVHGIFSYTSGKNDMENKKDRDSLPSKAKLENEIKKEKEDEKESESLKKAEEKNKEKIEEKSKQDEKKKMAEESKKAAEKAGKK